MALFSSIFAQCALVILVYGHRLLLNCPRKLRCCPNSVTKPKDERHFDFLGSVTGILGLFMVNIAWNQVPIVGWGELYVYVLLMLGISFLVAFVFIEYPVASSPGIANGQCRLTRYTDYGFRWNRSTKDRSKSVFHGA